MREHMLPNPRNRRMRFSPKMAERIEGNERQIVIALSGGEIVFFELDDTKQLGEVAKRDMNYEVLADIELLLERSCVFFAPCTTEWLMSLKNRTNQIR